MKRCWRKITKQRKDKQKTKKKVSDGVMWNQAGLNEQDALHLHVNTLIFQVIYECLATVITNPSPSNTKENHKTESSACKLIRSRRAQWRYQTISGNKRWKKKWKRRPGVTIKNLCPSWTRFSLITQKGRKPSKAWL